MIQLFTHAHPFTSYYQTFDSPITSLYCHYNHQRSTRWHEHPNLNALINVCSAQSHITFEKEEEEEKKSEK
jgi:hypothetical protein